MVPKSYDDAMLRPPNTLIGERPCCLGDRCICVWIARWRYGDDTDMAYIGTEFLLPSQYAAFQERSTLPATPGKCLVCSRYFHTFLYRCARMDPTFQPSSAIQIQAYGNVLGTECGLSIPTHTSVISDVDGYSPEAMLFVDEAWADTAAARTEMGTLLWRPCVRFSANHYEYVKDPETQLPRMLQKNLGSKCLPVKGVQDFGQPAPSTVGTVCKALTYSSVRVGTFYIL